MLEVDLVDTGKLKIMSNGLAGGKISKENEAV